MHAVACALGLKPARSAGVSVFGPPERCGTRVCLEVEVSPQQVKLQAVPTPPAPHAEAPEGLAQRWEGEKGEPKSVLVGPLKKTPVGTPTLVFLLAICYHSLGLFVVCVCVPSYMHACTWGNKGISVAINARIPSQGAMTRTHFDHETVWEELNKSMPVRQTKTDTPILIPRDSRRSAESASEAPRSRRLATSWASTTAPPLPTASQLPGLTCRDVQWSACSCRLRDTKPTLV